MAPLSSLQNCRVTKSNKTYTLREFLKRFAKKIKWGCMNYHVFQKKTINPCFPQKKKRSKKNQIKIKITKIRKNVMSITQFSWFKTFCISGWRLHASASQNHVHIRLRVHRFLFIYHFPKSNLSSLGWETLSKSQHLAFS